MGAHSIGLHRSLHSCGSLTLPSPWPTGPLLLLPLSHYRMLLTPAGRLHLQDCLLTLVRLPLPMSSHAPITDGSHAPWGASLLRIGTFSWALPSCSGFSDFAWGATDCPLNRAAICVCRGPGVCVACAARANLGMRGTCCWSALPCLTFFELNFSADFFSIL